MRLKGGSTKLKGGSTKLKGGSDIKYDWFINSDITSIFDKKYGSYELDEMDIVCREEIGRGYIRWLIKTAEDLDDSEDTKRICVFQKKDHLIVGLAIMDIVEDGFYSKKLILHLFCTIKNTEGLGRQLMKFIRTSKFCGQCNIELESVETARGFYERMGFHLKEKNDYSLDARTYKSKSRSLKALTKSKSSS